MSILPEPLEPLICDVCGDPAVGVAASPLGPVSFAYCDDCLVARAEPYLMLITTITLCGGTEHLAEWAKAIISPTLSRCRPPKTREEFDRDVVAECAEMKAELDRLYGPGETPGKEILP